MMPTHNQYQTLMDSHVFLTQERVLPIKIAFFPYQFDPKGK